MIDSSLAISFGCGLAYGGTSVLVGQPLDTVKTRMQALPNNIKNSMLSTGRDVYMREGIVGLYRGGLPLFIGGALFRSFQFGFYENSLRVLREYTPKHRIFGVIDYQVVCAGFIGGFGRGIVEGPFEFIKVRRQVEQKWTLKDFARDITQGGAATMVRNMFLFMSFSVYRDLSHVVVDGGLSPFLEGAICANLAWLTIWPMDVVKSQIQSGNYKGKSIFFLANDVIRTGILFRGIVPGLVRSTIANGSGMFVYKKVEVLLNDRLR